MIEKFSVTIPELTRKQPRNAYVYVPDAFNEDEEQRYPVLYMFDGHNLFFDEDATYGKSWGLLDFLEENEVPLIVAAVECNHNPNNGRLSEYSPFSFSDATFGRVRGRGRTTMEWFVNVFKPFVDGEYPTLPEREYTFIAGSSMGGLMSLYALTQYNHVFSRAAALSPSLWCDVAKLDRLICAADIDPNTVLYMDYGSEELSNHPHMKKMFSRIATRLLEKGVMLDARIVPGGTHTEASWEQQLPFFINTLFFGLE